MDRNPAGPRSEEGQAVNFHFPPALFVTGTDTGVGKTVVAAILTAGLDGIYWKPVQSGLEGVTDTEQVRQMTGMGEIHFAPETYRLRHPLSPHEAAELEGVRIELDRFQLPAHPPSTLIVEGAGGIMVPLNQEHTMLDLMKRLRLPVLLVARTALGTINHTLLSIEQLRRSGLEVLGVVMNGQRNHGNRQAIEHHGQVPVLAQIEPVENIHRRSLSSLFSIYFGASRR